MAIKKQLPRKHAGKKVSAKQEKEINEIRTNMIKNSPGVSISWLEAKHEYFEREERQKLYYNGSVKQEANLIEEIKNVDIKKTKKNDEQISVGTQKTQDKNVKKTEKSKKKIMSINETKLGITMVLNKDDCKKMGFKGTEITRDAIKEVRRRLGV